MALEWDQTRAERELLDTVERAGRLPAGRIAVHVHLSALMPGNRNPTHLRIAARLFGHLEAAHQVRVFSLSNGDIVVIGRDLPEDELDRIVHRVRSLFDEDPLTFYEADEDDPFVTWYALEVDHEELVSVVRPLLEAAELRRKQQVTAPTPPRPIEPADIEPLAEALRKLNIRQAVRRQPCIRLRPKRESEILFEEIFVSVSDVRQAIAPDIDLFSNRWLFQDFSRTLDSVVLGLLPKTEVLTKPAVVSLNLNVESLETAEFEGLLGALSPEQTVVVEVQLVDVFTNLSLYHMARDRLREGGHAVLIDGLSPAILAAMDMKLLDPDFVKIVWGPELAAAKHPRKRDGFKEILSELGPQRAVLARCDSEQSILWGLDKGITAFQGRFTDVILATVTMETCPQAHNCRMRDCAQRRASVAGHRRGECPNPPGLDAVQTFRPPQQPRRAPVPGNVSTR